MTKSWVIIIIIAVISILAVVGYDFYNSISGNNLSFNKEVKQIAPDLGTKQLQVLDTMNVNILVKNEELTDK